MSQDVWIVKNFMVFDQEFSTSTREVKLNAELQLRKGVEMGQGVVCVCVCV